MKNMFTAVILSVVLVGVSYAQAPMTKKARVNLVVTEFRVGEKATTMTAEAKRHFQASIAFNLEQTKRFKVVDIRRTRSASQPNLTVINATDEARIAAAARFGRQMGVDYVLVGSVNEYTPKDEGGHGFSEISVRLIDVATGRVKYTGDFSVRSGSPMKSGGQAEMQTHVMRHIIDQLADVLGSKV